LFLSSGDDAAELRDRVEDVVQVISKQFAEEGSALRFEVDRWESTAPQKAPEGAPVNEIFVQRVKESHLTLVLLFNEIRPGTLDELKAALEAKVVQLAVLWFDSLIEQESSPDALEVKVFLDAHRQQILYTRVTQAVDSREGWLEMIRVVSRLIASAVATQGATPLEERVEARPQSAGES
jgi:hypothetical protein